MPEHSLPFVSPVLLNYPLVFKIVQVKFCDCSMASFYWQCSYFLMSIFKCDLDGFKIWGSRENRKSCLFCIGGVSPWMVTFLRLRWIDLGPDILCRISKNKTKNMSSSQHCDRPTLGKIDGLLQIDGFLWLEYITHCCNCSCQRILLSVNAFLYCTWDFYI